MNKICDVGEDVLIKKFSRIYKRSKRIIVGIGDDAAIIKASRNKLLVITTDMLVENVHFLVEKTTPYKIGWKAIGTALSDIAAMAAVPKTAVVSIGLPKNLSVKFVNELSKGIEVLAKYFNVDIIGGDTVTSPHRIVISITVIGEVKKGHFVQRTGARIGDKILVTGSLGGSRKEKQYKFIPRIKEALWLTRHGKIHSMMDITDGLSLDLYRLVTKSKVGARLYENTIPISHDAKNIKNALCDGEDFELLIVASCLTAEKLIKNWKYKNVSLTIIGEIIKGKGKIELIDKYNRTKKLIPRGYEHFTK